MKEVLPTEVPESIQLIDVREPHEFTTIRPAGAVNIPLSEFVARVGEIDPDRDIYLTCHSGGRSGQAGEYLEQAFGWDNVINVAGGIVAWEAAGLPVERG